MYPVGWPLWKFLARLGVPLSLTLRVHFDPEAHVFWANSPDMDGLVVEAATPEDLQREALLAAELLLEIQFHVEPHAKLHIRPQLNMSAPLAAA